MARKKRKRLIVSGQKRLIIVITLILLISWFTYYLGTPMGTYITPAEKATIQQAQSLFGSSDTQTGGFTLYEIIIGTLIPLTQETANITSVARLLNGIAYISSIGLIAAAAGVLWSRNAAVWISGLFIGFSPMLLFWVSDLSPVTLTILATSMGFWALFKWVRQSRPLYALLSTLSFSIGSAFVPALLPWTISLPFILFTSTRHHRWQHFAFALISPALFVLVLATSQLNLPLNSLSFDIENPLSKLYALLNTYSQFDGKTYSVHRYLHLFLFLNPLTWGTALLTAALGVYYNIRSVKYEKRFLFLLIFTVITFLSLLLFSTNGNDRLALLPAFALLTAGLSLMPKITRNSSLPTLTTPAVILLSISVVTFSSFNQIRAEKQWTADYEMIAEANLDSGNTEAATIWARKVLEVHPDNSKMREAIIRAQFEAWATALKPSPIPVEIARRHLNRIREIEVHSQVSQSIEAVYLYKLRNNEEAIGLWQKNAASDPLARLSLYWLNKASKPTITELSAYEGNAYYSLLKNGLEVDRATTDSSPLTSMRLNNIIAYAH